MPSESAYAERAKLSPDTYGDPRWVEQRTSECISNLRQQIDTRVERGQMLFDLLGIGELSTPIVLDSILEKFTGPSELHRAVSAYTALAVNLKNGYTKMDDWDNLIRELIVPDPKFHTMQTEKHHQISLLYSENNEIISEIPEQFIIQTQERPIVDLESLRLDVSIGLQNSFGGLSLYNKGAQAYSEIETLLLMHERNRQNAIELALDFEECNFIPPRSLEK